jgi:hypothetical protein
LIADDPTTSARARSCGILSVTADAIHQSPCFPLAKLGECSLPS